MIAPQFTPPLETLSIGRWRAERFSEIGSTSDEARARAIDGDTGRLWIVADSQTAGRGRHGRAWTSPPGNLYASALIVDPCKTELATQIGFVAGVALQAAVSDLGAASAGLKWPNDLLADGAKLAGLLVEGVTQPGRALTAIVGFGVNLASSPEGLAYPTTSLRVLSGRRVEPLALLSRLSERFDEALAVWDRGAGFATIRERWLAHAVGLGGAIRVTDPRGVREGLFDGLDAAGRLRLSIGARIDIVESADVTFSFSPLANPAPGVAAESSQV